MTNNFNEVLKAKEKEEQDANNAKVNCEGKIIKLDDTQRVKVLSPGRLVTKRFLRNKLAIIGSAILIMMFAFAFICPLFYQYGQTDIFYKYDHLTVKYAQATERTDYTSYSVDNETDVHYSIRNNMTVYIHQLEQAGGGTLDITADDGTAYTIAKLGENVYTLNSKAGHEIAVYSDIASVATYNSKINIYTEIVPVGSGFEQAFKDAIASKASAFTVDGAYYYITSSVKNTYEARSLSSGTMNYMSSDMGQGFVEAFLQGVEAGSFSYGGIDYNITGDAVSGFAISEAGDMTMLLISSRYVFDAVDTTTVFSDEFRAQALLALYGDRTFTSEGSEYTIEDKPDGYFIMKDGQEFAAFSTFVVRRYSGEDTLALDFKAETENAITQAQESGNTIATFIYPLPEIDEEGNFLTDENGNNNTIETEITATFKVDGWVLTCDQITHLIDIYAPPSSTHIFGTDNDGFDVLARMMYGGRISLMVGFVVVILESILGVILGGIAGYFSGWIDSLIMRLVDIFYCLPTYPILIILGAFFDSVKMGSYTRLVWMMAVMGFLGWASVARLVRGQILSLREQEFMTAVESTGLSTERKIFRHLVPNVMPQLIVSATMGLGSVIIIEATLSFLGLGVKHPLATWGTMINSITSSNENLIRYAYIWIPVGLLICLTVIAFNFVGDGLRDAFDPKMKQQGVCKVQKKTKKANYISGRESAKITRFNRKLTKKLEKRRSKNNTDPTRYTTVMRDERNVVEFDNLCTYFFTDIGTVKAVDGITFEIPKGYTVGLVGESGCGKSVTSLSLMQLLQRPQGQTVGGEIRFNMGNGTAYNIVNTPTEEMMKIRGNKVSMIFQEPMTSLNPVFKAGDQIDEVIKLHNPNMTHKEVKDRTIEMLELVGIANPEGVYKMYPHELSGGMRQRIVIAMALACNPELIVADEPTTALDVTIQAQILELLKALKLKIGSSIMLITHDLGVVADMADYVVVMYAGRIVEKGTSRDIFHDAKHPYTIGLMKSKPIVGKKVEELYSIHGSVPNPVNMPDYCYFRDRCDYCFETCMKSKYPPVYKVSDTHYVSCYRYQDQGEVAATPMSVNVKEL